MKRYSISLVCAGVLGASSLTIAPPVGAGEPAGPEPPPPPPEEPAPPTEKPAPPSAEPAPPPVAPAETSPTPAEPAPLLGVPAEALTEPGPAQPAEEDRSAPPGTMGGSLADDWFRSLDLTVHLGLGVRLDDPPALAPDSTVGLLFGGGADLFFTDYVSVGAHYEHLDLGEEGGELGTGGTIHLTRDLNTMWFKLRAYPWRGESLAFYVAIAAGMVWQSADATGSVWDPTQPGVVVPFQCEASDSVNVGMRGAIGLDGSPSPPLRLWTSLGFDSYRLDDAFVDGCAPGAGTAGVLGLRAGVAYGIPLRGSEE